MKRRVKAPVRLFDMQSFGRLRGGLEHIRIDRLEERLQPLIPFPHKHDFFQLLIPSQAQGWHEIDFTRHDLGKNPVMVLKPGQVHAWEIGVQSRGFLVEFEARFVQKLLRLTAPELRLQELPDVLTIEDRTAVLGLCELMHSEQKAEAPGWENVLLFQLLALLLQILRGSESESVREDQGSSSDPFLQNFLSLVESHHAEQHSLEFYAEALQVSVKALSMRLSRSHGLSAKALIQDRNLLEAKRLLAHSSLTQAEIAREVGFEDQNYFIRVFKKKTGQTPAEFRRLQKRD